MNEDHTIAAQISRLRNTVETQPSDSEVRLCDTRATPLCYCWGPACACERPRTAPCRAGVSPPHLDDTRVSSPPPLSMALSPAPARFLPTTLPTTTRDWRSQQASGDVLSPVRDVPEARAHTCARVRLPHVPASSPHRCLPRCHLTLAPENHIIAEFGQQVSLPVSSSVPIITASPTCIHVIAGVSPCVCPRR